MVRRGSGVRIPSPALRANVLPAAGVYGGWPRDSSPRRPSRARGTDIRSRPYRLLVVVSVVVLAACTTGRPETGPPRAPSVDPRIDGTLLVFTGFRSGLATIELPGDDPRPLMLPEEGAFARGAFFLPDGSVLGTLQLGFDRMGAFILSEDHPPVALGPALRGEFTSSLSGDRLLAARCVPRPNAFVLDLNTPSAGWRETPGSCGAMLSPEGDTFVWSPDGRFLLEAAVERGGDAEKVLDVAELSNMPPGMDDGVSIIGRLDWGRRGSPGARSWHRRPGATLRPPFACRRATRRAWSPSIQTRSPHSSGRPTVRSCSRRRTPGGRSSRRMERGSDRFPFPGANRCRSRGGIRDQPMMGQ